MKEFTGRLAWVAGPTAGVVGLAAAAVIGLPTVAEAQPVCMGAMMHVSHGAAGAFSLPREKAPALEGAPISAIFFG